MKPHELLQKRMEEFEKEFENISYEKMIYGVPTIVSYDVSAIKSFSLATSLALIESFEEMVGEEETFIVDPNNLVVATKKTAVNDERSRLRTLLREEKEKITKMI